MRTVRKQRFEAVEARPIAWNTQDANIAFQFYNNGPSLLVTGRLDVWELVALANACKDALRKIRAARKSALDSADNALVELGGDK